MADALNFAVAMFVFVDEREIEKRSRMMRYSLKKPVKKTIEAVKKTVNHPVRKTVSAARKTRKSLEKIMR